VQLNNFKHLAILTFYQYFASNETARNQLQWEKKEDNFEQIVVHINFAVLHRDGPNNIK
jgi:DNA helicase MCM8